MEREQSTFELKSRRQEEQRVPGRVRPVRAAATNLQARVQVSGRALQPYPLSKRVVEVGGRRTTWSISRRSSLFSHTRCLAQDWLEPLDSSIEGLPNQQHLPTPHFHRSPSSSLLAPQPEHTVEHTSSARPAMSSPPAYTQSVPAAGLRVPCSSFQTFPDHSLTGPAAFRDLDGSPVFVCSVLMDGKSVSERAGFVAGGGGALASM